LRQSVIVSHDKFVIFSTGRNMHCSTLCRAAGRASTVKVRAGPESKQASVNKTVTSSGGDGRDADERIRVSQFSRVSSSDLACLAVHHHCYTRQRSFMAPRLLRGRWGGAWRHQRPCNAWR
jgi:hypothetical protein